MPQLQDTANPFGSPEGAREHLDEITRNFVSFGKTSAWGGLATPPDDLTARVLVGRKGSGKTLYLRRLQAHASIDASIYADAIQQDHIGTSDVIQFCQWFPPHEVGERWKQLWRRAIIRSLLSHLLCNQKISRSASEALRGRIHLDFPSVKRFRAAVSVYSQVADILHECSTRSSLEKYFRDSGWSELEAVISESLVDFPPICFYIDDTDAEFEKAPAYWLACQKGLFHECMNLLRDSKFGSRLHVIICVRDIVLSSVFNSEHQCRYVGEPHIRVLNWNKHSINYFLEEKIKRLPSAHIAKHGLGDLVPSWLGISTIDNLEREIEEPIRQYLLRHTRLLPRDIVVLGNLLCEGIGRAKAASSEHDVGAVIRATVSKAARSFGNEQLHICANELASESMPRYAAKYRYDETYTANAEYSQEIERQLRELIASFRCDRFSRETLENVRKAERSGLFDGQIDPWSILWRSGLIGYVEGRGNGEKHIFYSDERIDQFHLPTTMSTYLLHPILIDSVGVSSHGHQPVIPFKNGEIA